MCVYLPNYVGTNVICEQPCDQTALTLSDDAMMYLPMFLSMLSYLLPSNPDFQLFLFLAPLLFSGDCQMNGEKL